MILSTVRDSSTGSPRCWRISALTTASKRTCTWLRSPAGTGTSSPASCSAYRSSRSGPARSRGPASALPSMSCMMMQAVVQVEKANGLHQGVSGDADRLLERSRGRDQAAYFERFQNVGVDGDFAEWTVHGGMIIHCRSDANSSTRVACALARRRSIPRSNRCPRSAEALWIAEDFDKRGRAVRGRPWR